MNHKSPTPRKKALFLYSRMAGYFIACVQRLTEAFPVDVHIVRLPVNDVAPFNFSELPNVYIYDRYDYDEQQLQKLVQDIEPDFIFCNGWIDPGYLKICRKYYGKVATVLTLDNPWLGTIKQYVGTLLARIAFPRMFSNVWVPGPPHLIYARKLGFKKDQTFIGKYSANFNWFNNQYKINHDAKLANFPKRIIYVGRYTELKGVKEMWNAFIRLQNAEPNEWELWCLGKGEYTDRFPVHEKVKNFGFVQPSDLDKFIAQTGVFILPSQIEHWGVVVHEFAAAGYPIISTDRTNAASLFLQDGHNGFRFKAGDEESLYQAFKKLIHMPVAELQQMGERSIELARIITPDTWSAQVWQWIEKYQNKH